MKKQILASILAIASAASFPSKASEDFIEPLAPLKEIYNSAENPDCKNFSHYTACQNSQVWYEEPWKTTLNTGKSISSRGVGYYGSVLIERKGENPLTINYHDSRGNGPGPGDRMTLGYNRDGNRFSVFFYFNKGGSISVHATQKIDGELDHVWFNTEEIPFPFRRRAKKFTHDVQTSIHDFYQGILQEVNSNGKPTIDYASLEQKFGHFEEEVAQVLTHGSFKKYRGVAKRLEGYVQNYIGTE